MSGNEEGSISLWSARKKRPLFTKPLAHGYNSKYIQDGEEQKVKQSEKEGESVSGWVVSLATLPSSNCFVSGGGDGHIRIWKISATKQSFTLVHSLEVGGFINSLSFTQMFVNGEPRWVLLVAQGKEYRFGRWYSVKDGRNAALVIDFGPIRQ